MTNQTPNKDTASNNKPAQELRLERLEDRVLYSAVPMPVDMAEMAECPDVAEDPAVDNPFDSSNDSMDTISDGIDQLISVESMGLDLSLIHI